MKGLIVVLTMSLIIGTALASGLSLAAEKMGGRTYEVTITNLTRGQIFSPPVVISHDSGFQLFKLGDPAIPELVSLAEDGITNQLIGLIKTLPSVLDYTVANGPLTPGNSLTLKITARGNFDFISAAGMLVTTNDAFFAIRNVKVLPMGDAISEAQAYDAGSENNSESCGHIPGPPCGNAGVRNTVGAEGYVHIHAGIHGIADLIASRDDWRNPVAEIMIRPAN